MERLQAVQEAILDGKHKQLSSLLQNYQPDVTSAPIDEEGTTLLHLAANTENPRVLSILLDVSVDVNTQNGDGFTPLHVAAMWGREECVKLLIEKGADPGISDNDEMTPLDYSESEGHFLCTELLRNWSSPSKENCRSHANLTQPFPQSLTDSHLSPTPSPTHDCLQATVDQSMAETFVSMYLNMTQTQVAEDLTDVTQISNLDESPSLLDILTSQHTIPPHDKRQDANQRTVCGLSENLREKVSQQQWEKAGCVRRLQLNYLQTEAADSNGGKSDTIHSLTEECGGYWPEKGAVAALPKELDNSKLQGSVVSPVTQQDSSLLVLESQSNSFDSPPPSSPPSVDSPDELFTTALEPPTTPISPPRSPSIPFLAESLKKIELRRRALRASQQQQPLTPPHTTSSLQKALPSSPVVQPNRAPEGQSVPLPSDRSHQQCLTAESSPLNPEEIPAEEDDVENEALMKADYTNSSLLANCSFAADITTQIPRHLHSLTNQELRQRLVARGEQPGPITELTRAAYLVYLSKLEAGIQPAGNTGYKDYRYELALVLNGTAPVPDFSALEYEVFRQYRVSRLPNSPLRTLPSITAPAFPLPRSLVASLPTSPRSKRDWFTKTHFNYLLLDPAHLDKMDACQRDSVQQFRTFVEAVFYVGKGKNARSLQHLKDARDKMHLPQPKLSAKLSRIISIWRAGQGVVSLHIFHHTTAEEAFTREACMIDAIGLDMLTNIQKGHLYGEVSHWGAGKRRQFGVFLLHKAYLSYLLDPPQPVGQDDL